MTDPVLDEPLVVVTSDSHVNAPLEAYRPYVPKKYAREFEDFVEQAAAMREALLAMFRPPDAPEPGAQPNHRASNQQNTKTNGHMDIHERLRDMDFDGIAAEVIFFGTMPFDPFPFTSRTSGDPSGGMDTSDRAAAGMRIYNRWLSDFCSVEPERHVGLAHLPMWDIDLALQELEVARELGLKGVNFPAPRREIAPYEDPAWDPFWSACEDLGMVLANHGGGGVTAAPATGPGAMFIYTTETVAMSRYTPVNRFVWGGVFEKHPRLKLVQTEQPGNWFGFVMDELDSQYRAHADQLPLPKLPSEYLRSNYFVGASFQSHLEAEGAVLGGYDGNIIWGSDYPHGEGTFRFPDSFDEVPVTHLSLRATYAGLPADATRAMIGRNGVDVYGLDGAALEKVAARINAPTLRDLSEVPEERPAHWSLAFRTESSYT
jgi:predicted TIM-barrel fold metal-dependent hydrolase